MLKLTTILCGGLFLTMLIGGRDESQVRYGLQGRIPTLSQVVAQHMDAPKPVVEVAADQPLPVQPKAEQPVTQDPAVVPASLSTLAASPAVETDTTTYTGYTQDALGGGMSLSMPMVQPTSETVTTDNTEVEPVGGYIAYVSGSSVNVRSGPSAETEPVARLARGESVLVLPSDTPGWSMIRIEGDGVEGYIASRFLSQTSSEGSGPVGD